MVSCCHPFKPSSFQQLPGWAACWLSWEPLNQLSKKMSPRRSSRGRSGKCALLNTHYNNASHVRAFPTGPDIDYSNSGRKGWKIDYEVFSKSAGNWMPQMLEWVWRRTMSALRRVLFCFCLFRPVEDRQGLASNVFSAPIRPQGGAVCKTDRRLASTLGLGPFVSKRAANVNLERRQYQMSFLKAWELNMFLETPLATNVSWYILVFKSDVCTVSKAAAVNTKPCFKWAIRHGKVRRQSRRAWTTKAVTFLH